MADCCGPKVKRDNRVLVRSAYGRIAKEGGSCCGGKSCQGGSGSNAVAGQIGYSKEDLKNLPKGANLGLGCGNPGAIAELKPGETVLDLGSGAGIDAFLAARKVGPKGKVIGVDMTPDMLEKARANVAAFRKRSGLKNVEFRLGEIEHLPVADASVDTIISNCVINLSSDKPSVWCEVARVLKPGGRMAVSDLALTAPLPACLKNSVAALTACIAGAVTVAETEKMVRAAGLTGLAMESRPYPVEAVADISDPLYRKLVASLPKGRTFGDYIVSLSIKATKPRGPGGKPKNGGARHRLVHTGTR